MSASATATHTHGLWEKSKRNRPKSKSKSNPHETAKRPPSNGYYTSFWRLFATFGYFFYTNSYFYKSVFYFPGPGKSPKKRRFIPKALILHWVSIFCLGGGFAAPHTDPPHPRNAPETRVTHPRLCLSPSKLGQLRPRTHPPTSQTEGLLMSWVDGS